MKNKLKKVGLAATTAVAGLSLAVNQVRAETLDNILKPAEIGGDLDYTQIVPKVINVVFLVAAALTFFYLIFGAISWITSGGDKGKVEAARNKITAAVIGLLILAATWAAFSLIIQIFFGKSLSQIELPSLSK